MGKVTETLIKAKAVISDENYWCTKYPAIGDAGEEFDDPTDPRASAWCMAGAVGKVGSDCDVREKAFLYLESVIRLKYEDYDSVDTESVDMLVDFNDDPKTEHKDVMEVFDLAVILANDDKA